MDLIHILLLLNIRSK